MKATEIRLPYRVQLNNGSVYVEYRVFNHATGKLERYRISKGINNLAGEQREAMVKNIIEDYTARLRRGWRPWHEEKTVYRDLVEYHYLSSANREVNNANNLRNLFSEYLHNKKSELADKSFADLQSKLRIFTYYLENSGLAVAELVHISNSIMIGFFNYLIQDRKLDKRTVAKYRQYIWGMFEWFLTKKLIPENPVHHIPKAVKRVDMAARPMTKKHMQVLLRHWKQTDMQMFFAYIIETMTLCRPGSELRLFRIHDIDLDNKTLYLNEPNAKTRGRVIVLPDALVEIIQTFELHKYPHDYFIFGRDGRPGPVPVGVNYFNRKFAEARKTLGLPDTYKFYSGKHTGAGRLLEDGATLVELMNHMGHKRLASTEAYVRRHFGEKSEKVINFRPDFLDGLD